MKPSNGNISISPILRRVIPQACFPVVKDHGFQGEVKVDLLSHPGGGFAHRLDVENEVPPLDLDDDFRAGRQKGIDLSGKTLRFPSGQDPDLFIFFLTKILKNGTRSKNFSGTKLSIVH